MKVIWENDAVNYVDEAIKKGIENNVLERTNEIRQIQTFLRGLGEDLPCHADVILKILDESGG